MARPSHQKKHLNQNQIGTNQDEESRATDKHKWTFLYFKTSNNRTSSTRRKTHTYCDDSEKESSDSSSSKISEMVSEKVTRLTAREGTAGLAVTL